MLRLDPQDVRQCVESALAAMASAAVLAREEADVTDARLVRNVVGYYAWQRCGEVSALPATGSLAAVLRLALVSLRTLLMDAGNSPVQAAVLRSCVLRVAAMEARRTAREEREAWAGISRSLPAGDREIFNAAVSG